MLETIKRNREALELITDDGMISSLATVNNLLSLDTIVQFNKQGHTYVLADGLIVSVE